MQIFWGAPVFINTASIDPLEIALEEMNLGVIPITVKRDKNR